MAREYTHVIHVSHVNKLLLTRHCRAELLDTYPELANGPLSENRILTSMLKNYLGVNYFKHKSDIENELAKARGGK